MAAQTPNLDLRKLQKNYIINGDMRIAQRGNSFVAIGNQYSLDRWRYSKSGAMVHTLTRDTDVPTVAQSGYRFENSLRLNLTTPDTTIAVSDNQSIDQVIEGYNWAYLAQKSFTLSFWVKATLPGIYCVAFRNSGADRTYVAEYTINISDTWEHKTITVSASPVAGTWNYANGIGLDIRWVLASGTNFHTTPNAWNTGNFIATANQINGVNTGATDFRITGVCLNEGTEAQSFKLFGEDFGGEIKACQRYYEKSYDLETLPGTVIGAGSEPNTFRGYNGAGGATRGWANFLVRKRVAPTMVYYSGTSSTPGNINLNGTASAANASVSTEVGTWVENNVATNGFYTYGFLFTADAEL